MRKLVSVIFSLEKYYLLRRMPRHLKIMGIFFIFLSENPMRSSRESANENFIRSQLESMRSYTKISTIERKNLHDI